MPKNELFNAANDIDMFLVTDSLDRLFASVKN